MMTKIARIVTLIVIGLTPLVIIPQVSYPFVFGKTLFITVWAIILLLLGAYLAYQKENRAHVVTVMKNPLVYFPVVILTIDSVLSLFGMDVVRSFIGNEERGMGLLHLWLVMVVYVATWLFFPSRTDKKIVSYTILGSSVAVVIAALLRYADILLFGIDTGFRISGTIANAIFFAQAALLYAGIAVMVAFDEQEKKWIRLSAGAVALLQVIAIILSKTRGTFVALVAMACVMGLYAIWNHKEWRAIVKKVCMGLLVVVVLFFVSATTFLKDNSDIERLSKFSLQDTTTKTRFLAWRAGLHAFYERPVAGWGNENFKYAFDKYYEPELLEFGYSETHFDRAHNIVVERMVNFGALGVLAYLVYFFGVAYAVYRNDRISSPKKMIFLGLWCANHVHLLFAFDTALSVMLQLVVLYYVAPELPTRITEKTKNVVAPLIGLALIACVPILYLVVYPYQSSNQLVRAYAWIDQGKLSHAIPYYELALRIPSPYFHAPREEYARTAVKILQNKKIGEDESLVWLFNRALQVSDELIQRNPSFSPFYEIKGNVNLTRMLEDDVYAQRAIEQYNLAQERSPKRQAYYFARAQVYNLQKNFVAADAEYTVAYQLAPTVPEPLMYKGISLLVLGKDDEAKELILETLHNEIYPSSFHDWQLLATALARWGETKFSAFYYLVGLRANPENDEIALYFAASAYRAGLMRETYEGLQYTIDLGGAKKEEAQQLLQLLPNDTKTKPYVFDEAEEFFE